MAGLTLFDKLWDTHTVLSVEEGPDVLYIDRHYIHEVTSPQAFEGLRKRGIGVHRPGRTTATADHNIPTIDQHLVIRDDMSRAQVETLARNCMEFGIEYSGLNDPGNGIVHVIGPERGLTRPGMTIVCGDSHTSTHGAFGTIAFGIGTSEVEMVLATQCIMQSRPAKMRITVDGTPGKGVTSKDIALHIVSQITSGGATGYFIEFAGNAISKFSMEARMTLCNMSIEMGARGGMIAPDEVTYSYLSDVLPAEEVERWREMITRRGLDASDPDALFDKELFFKADLIRPMITFGTNPGMAIAIDDSVPEGMNGTEEENASFLKALKYMGFRPGQKLLGHKTDYVFLGSCTNGRIEDMRAFAGLVKGRKKSPDVTALIVPGSKNVERQAREEGLVDILNEAGFEVRQPGCSSCLAMNEDKIPTGKYAVSTSNRNFEGRQGPGARTILASPLTAAAAAVTGRITDPREFL